MKVEAADLALRLEGAQAELRDSDAAVEALFHGPGMEPGMEEEEYLQAMRAAQSRVKRALDKVVDLTAYLKYAQAEKDAAVQAVEQKKYEKEAGVNPGFGL